MVTLPLCVLACNSLVVLIVLLLSGNTRANRAAVLQVCSFKCWNYVPEISFLRICSLEKLEIKIPGLEFPASSLEAHGDNYRVPVDLKGLWGVTPPYLPHSK